MFTRSAIIRFISTTTRNFSEAEKKVSKEALMALRKKTGYSYVNCRKALVKFGETDMENAEKWLREAAAKEGWAKAAKLGSRVTSNGLVAVACDVSTAVVVELSCETDFVARSDHFKQLLQNISTSALEKAKSDLGTGKQKGIQSISYDLADVVGTDGKNMKEVLSLAIGKLGENMNVKKLNAYKAPKDSVLYGNSHPKDGTDSIPMGRFVSLIALQHQNGGSISSQQLAGQLCQHIIGMSPETLGEAPTTKNVESLKAQEGHDPDADPVHVTNIDDSETALLRQSFMLNPSQSVYEYLTTHNAKLFDFKRVELGNE